LEGVEVVCGETTVRVKGRGWIMSREEGEKGGEMGMVKFGRSGGSVWRDRGADKGERTDHEPRGGRKRWRHGDGEIWKEWR
jgi:hypothetical protein